MCLRCELLSLPLLVTRETEIFVIMNKAVLQ